MVNEYYRSVKNTEYLTAQNNQLLQDIQFTNAIGAVANLVAAREARKQTQLQEQQLYLQQVSNQQQSHYHAVMWRQSEEGKIFQIWHQKALQLLTLIRYRNALWQQIWEQSLPEVKSMIPCKEKINYRLYLMFTKSTGLLWISRILLTLGSFTALLYGALLLMSISNHPDRLNEILLVALLISPLMFPLLLGLGLIPLRKLLMKRVQTSSRFTKERDNRIEKWGFDPLSLPDGSIGFAWWVEPGLQEYEASLEFYLTKGFEVFPHPNELPQIRLPKNCSSNHTSIPALQEILSLFTEQQKMLTSGN